MSTIPTVLRPALSRIDVPSWYARAGDVIRSIGTEFFHRELIRLLEASIRSEAVWVIRYSGEALPDVVYTHNVLPSAYRVYVEQCASVDPFSRRWRTKREAGVLTRAALRDESEEYRRYTELFLPAADVEDELGVFFPVTAHNCFAFFLERDRGRFAAIEARRARLMYPALEGLYRAHLGWLFNELRYSDTPEATGLINRPTLIRDRAGEKVYSNDTWNEAWDELVGRDPSLAAKMEALAGRHSAQVVLDSQVLKSEALGADFPLAPGGRMFVIEPRAPDEGDPAGHAGAAMFEILSPRERDILDLVMQGWSTAEISERLAIGIGTVKNCKTRLYRKVEVATERALVTKFRPFYEPAGSIGGRERGCVGAGSGAGETARDAEAGEGQREGAGEGAGAAIPAPVRLLDEEWFHRIGEVASSIGTDRFHGQLVGLFGATIAHSASWIIRYSRGALPDVIHTSNTPQEVVDFYIAHCAPLDPFSAHWRRYEEPGVRTLASFGDGPKADDEEIIDPRPYNRLFKAAAGITDELGMFFSTVGHSTLGLFLEREKGHFTDAEIRRAQLVFPMLDGFHKAHIGRLFDRLRYMGDANESGIASRPTLVRDRCGLEIYANPSWREAVAADPSIMAAVASAGEDRSRQLDRFTLTVERFDQYFPLAPSGAMFVLTPRAEPEEALVDPAGEGGFEDTLTARECEIFELMMAGRTTGSIAQALKIAKGSVKNYRLRIYRKAGVVSERALVQKYGRAAPLPGKS